MTFKTINPATEEIIEIYEELNSEVINEKLKLSQKAFLDWRNTSFSDRSELMIKVSDILRDNKISYAELMSVEMGKPFNQGLSEVEKCAWVCEYYAQYAESILADDIISTEIKSSYVAYLPIGPVLAIMPWNFPFWQVFRFAAPTIMAGNTGILKHARNTMGCAIAIEDVFTKAGFPKGVFTNLIIGSGPVDEIIKNKIVKAVTLTGSTPVGMQVASTAGSVLKKSVMELGGSDPYVVLADADVEHAAKICASARLVNSGQSCIAAKRFIVEKSIIREFEELFTIEMKKAAMGNPLDKSVTVGPQARKDLQLDLHRQVEDSIAKGAKLLLGGNIPEGAGFFYPPTILSNIQNNMAAYNEETFGPVAAIINADNESDAIEKANDTCFGLGAAVFTADLEKGNDIARNKLNAGCCFVNDFVRSDPRLPFGGVKDSGFGRELGTFGIKEFINIKSICVY
jgi:succinate-semialdehyde dehydrogenase / glutarate-semialdehyde dehydrogenase